MIVWTARQLGFPDRRLCPQLNRLASDYIQKREGWEDTVYSFFASDPDCDSLFIKLVEEFERCILSYFAFHWSYAETALKQVINQKTCYVIRLAAKYLNMLKLYG